MDSETIGLNTDTLKRRKGGDIEAKVSLRGDDGQRHELFDSTGLRIMIVVSGHERYIGEGEPEKIAPDQRGLIDDQAA